MQVSEPKKPRAKRHPLWSKETLEEELLHGSSSITAILKKYSIDGQWKATYGDFCRWRKEDPGLAERAKQYALKRDPKKRQTMSGGRAPMDADPEHADWRAKYCEKLLETKNRATACEATPYNYDTIYKKLNPKYSEYDQEFFDMVHAVEMKLLAYAEEIMYTALDNEPSWRNKAWIAKEVLKVRDRERWSDKLDISIEHKGVVKFEANRQRMLAELAQEQVAQLKPAQKALESGQMDYVDVELLGEEVVSE